MTLGNKVHMRLKELGIETPFFASHLQASYASVVHHFQKIMTQGLGLDLRDDSLGDTPQRIAKMYTEEIFYGLDYKNFPKCTSIANGMKYDELITSRATVASVCEHHFVPFMGVAYVGYLPKEKVVGLSKVNRIVDFFSRRPQVQERLTMQIYAALELVLETEDVAVVVQAEHFCVKLRGVKDEASCTTTSKMGGRFMSKPELRAEFLTLVGRSPTL